MSILFGIAAKPIAKTLSNTTFLSAAAAKKLDEKMKDKKKNADKPQVSKKMAHDGMTCRGKGAAIKGANYKG